MSQHEQLTQRFDESAACLRKETDAHRLLSDTAMQASAETNLETGAQIFLDSLYESNWVSRACFWDARNNTATDAPQYAVPAWGRFPRSPLLLNSLKTGERSVSEVTNAGKCNAY